jgi:membrane protease YdiL (CAAX protease family)
MQPIGLAQSFLWFGIPSVIFSWFLLWWLPRLLAGGMALAPIFLLTFATPLALMLLAALYVYRREGNPWTWPAFRDRMRLQRMTGADVLWTIGLVVGVLLLGRLFSMVVGDRELFRFYTHPAGFTQFMSQLSTIGAEWAGFTVKGNWLLLIAYLLILIVVNIFGEELWWRGIILPRQELALGNYAWVVNGVLWAAFHAFYHSTLAGFLSYVPGTTLLAYVCWKRKSTWPGIIAHTIQNSGVPIMLFKGITS